MPAARRHRLPSGASIVIFSTSAKGKGKGSSRRVLGLRLVDRQGYFVDFQVKHTRSRCIEWAEAPLAVAYFHPLVVSVHVKRLKLHHLATAKLVHSVPHALKVAGLLIPCSGSFKEVSIWYCFCPAASASDIMALLASLISEQLRFLTAPEQAHFVEALKSIATPRGLPERLPRRGGGLPGALPGGAAS